MLGLGFGIRCATGVSVGRAGLATRYLVDTKLVSVLVPEGLAHVWDVGGTLQLRVCGLW